IVLAVAERDLAGVTERARDAGVEALELGSAGGDRVSIAAAERDVSVALPDAERAWRSLGDSL
ncbi:MAG: hypothetical protein WB771_08315, partial [Solirubrobacterales bacterium]